MSDRILGLVCLVIAAAMAWAAHGYAAEISYEPVGPRAFPTVLAGVLAVCGAWLVARPARITIWPAGDHTVFLQMLLASMGAVLAYALLFQWLGFVLATTLMSLPVGWAFGGRPMPVLMGGLGIGVLFYFLFDKLLDVILPTGLLSFVLEGR